MKKPLKNEIDMLDLINKIQAHLIVLDKKIDTLLINRPLPQARPSSTPSVDNDRTAARPNDHHKERMMHKAICADCQKECTIPFKPSGDRPVYCKDCFSRRKVISMSGMKFEEKPQIVIPEPKVKEKKKAVTVKKPIAKKKTVPKKK